MSQGNSIAGSTYIDDVLETEREVPKCEGCGEPEDDLFALGIKAHGLNKESKVCSVCLNMIHEEFTVNLTE